MRIGGKNEAFSATRKGARQHRNRPRFRVVASALTGALLALASIPFAGTASAQAIDPFAPGEVIDFREHMRAFIQSISAYGRSLNPRFVLVVRDGLDLIVKPDPQDEQIKFPAQAYIRAIDGLMETGALDETVTTKDGKPDPTLAAIVKRRKENLAIAQGQGLSMFGLEFTTDAATVDQTYRALDQAGLVPFVAESERLNGLPAHPARTFAANPKNINAVADAKNYLYIANSSAFGQASDFIRALRDTNHDIVVIDVFHQRKPLTKNDIELLKYKKLGAKRLVLAEIDIATAAPFNYFWKPDWAEGSPPFLYKPVREDPDRHRAIYWDEGWMSIFRGDFNSYVYGAVDLGFDGVVIKGADAWTFFEKGGDE